MYVWRCKGMRCRAPLGPSADFKLGAKWKFKTFLYFIFFSSIQFRDLMFTPFVDDACISVAAFPSPLVLHKTWTSQKRRKTTQIRLKGSDALVRWFFTRIHCRGMSQKWNGSTFLASSRQQMWRTGPRDQLTDQWKSVMIGNLAGWDLRRITACVLYTVQCKSQLYSVEMLEISPSFCQRLWWKRSQYLWRVMLGRPRGK